MILNTKLNSQEQLNENMLSKAKKNIGLLWNLHNILPRVPLLAICKSFVRSHLDYGDVVYDQSCNNNFRQKMESVQDNAALAIEGAIKGSSRKKSLPRIRSGILTTTAMA